MARDATGSITEVKGDAVSIHYCTTCIMYKGIGQTLTSSFAAHNGLHTAWLWKGLYSLCLA